MVFGLYTGNREVHLFFPEIRLPTGSAPVSRVPDHSVPDPDGLYMILLI